MESSTARPPVSIIITARNEASRLGRLLDSLFVQEPPFEIVLVDGESRDGTFAVAQAYARRHPETMRVFQRASSRGRGRNIGCAAARYSFYAFIDADCWADPGWLASLRRELSHRTVLAGTTRTVGPARYQTLERIELYQSGFDVTYPSCNLLYPADLFWEIDGFDPRFVTAEDIDLNLRAVEAGARIRPVPTATVFHEVRTTVLGFLVQAFWNGYGRKQLTEKHGSLWGRYRYRELVRSQGSLLGASRLSAALLGYGVRILTATGRGRLRPEGNSSRPPRSPGPLGRERSGQGGSVVLPPDKSTDRGDRRGTS